MRTAVSVCAALATLGACRACLAAESPFRPHPDFVVLTVPQGSADRSTPAMRERARGDARAAAITARRYLEQARTDGAPELVGHAEAILRPWMRDARQAPVTLLVLQADIAQRRHDFAAAEQWLDRALARNPRDTQARLMRATTSIVRGELDSAAPHCRAVLAAGEFYAGTACLAQVIGGSDPRRAAGLLSAMLARTPQPAAHQLAWGFGILADLSRRLGDVGAAEQHLRSAHELAPEDDAHLVLLADVLLEAGRAGEVLTLLKGAAVSPAVLVQQARAEQQLGRRAELSRTLTTLGEQFAIEARRGERVHLREQALLALHVGQDARRALGLALENFELQRETVDVRLLARAASAAGDVDALEKLNAWITATSHRDLAVDRVLTRSAS